VKLSANYMYAKSYNFPHITQQKDMTLRVLYYKCTAKHLRNGKLHCRKLNLTAKVPTHCRKFCVLQKVQINNVKGLKGQCQKILECLFFIKLLLLVALHLLCDNFNFCRIFAEILNKSRLSGVWYTAEWRLHSVWYTAKWRVGGVRYTEESHYNLFLNSAVYLTPRRCHSAE